MTTETTPEAVIGSAAVKRLTIAGFDIVERPIPKKVRHRYTCPMCGYSEYGGMALDAFADWGEAWHGACVSPYDVAPSKRGDNRPMIHTEEAA